MIMTPPWTARQVGRSVHLLEFQFESRSDEARILLRGDAHHDSVDSLPALEKRHLQAALLSNSPVIDNGDSLDLMQGAGDPRGSKSKVKPAYLVNDRYFDNVINEYAEFLSPFSKVLFCWGVGNHESNIAKRYEWNPITRLVERIRTLTGDTIYEAGYQSWVIIRVRRGPEKNNGAKRINLWRSHGYGAGGGHTKNVGQVARHAYTFPDAHICVTGHCHNSWSMTYARARLKGYKVYQDEQLHIAVPSYKDEYQDGYSVNPNWSIEKGMPPKPVGAVWLRISFGKGEDRDRLVYEVERAK